MESILPLIKDENRDYLPKMIFVVVGTNHEALMYKSGYFFAAGKESVPIKSM
jgi:hypothetical protein